jgi:hypothetical protein
MVEKIRQAGIQKSHSPSTVSGVGSNARAQADSDMGFFVRFYNDPFDHSLAIGYLIKARFCQSHPI